MATHDDFLRAILAHPEDDTPRLVYADWLEEHGGQPQRAEFIRIQCELARLPPARKQLRDCNVYVLPPDYFDVMGRESLIIAPTRAEGTARVAVGEVSRGEEVDVVLADGSYIEGMVVVDVVPLGDGQSVAAARLESGGSVDAHRRRRGELKKREKELLIDHQPGWIFGTLGEQFRNYVLNPEQPAGWPYWKWSRGFISEVTMTCDDWLRHRDALLGATPLEAVTLTHLPTQIMPESSSVRLLKGKMLMASWRDGESVVQFRVSFDNQPQGFMDITHLVSARAAALLPQ